MNRQTSYLQAIDASCNADYRTVVAALIGEENLANPPLGEFLAAYQRYSHRQIVFPSDVLTRQQLDEIAYPCEHATADVLADDGQRMTLRCTWGCGRLIETAVTA